MARGGVIKVDPELGIVVIVWEGIKLIFAATATGNKVRLLPERIYLFKDRLYDEPKIPKKIFQQAGAIFASRRKKRLQALSQKLRESQAGMQKSEQLVLF